MRTLAARAVSKNLGVAYIVNEPEAGDVYADIFSALNSMWAGQLSEAEIDRMMDTNMVIYDRIYHYERIETILRWSKPQLAIVDTLDNLSFPECVSHIKNADEKHSERARGLLEMTRRYNCMLHIPSNASEGNQRALRDD